MVKGVGPKEGGLAVRRNLPAQERKQVLLDAALDIFSEKGMSITVQELADRVQVTQPLVHRYFPAKADLIAAILDTLQNAHWDPAWRATLADRSRPLDERIIAFYQTYLPHVFNDRWYRGFLFAALEDPRFAQAYLGHVDREIFAVIINETRVHFGFAPIETTPVCEREIELVWGMHSTFVYVGIRRHVYDVAVCTDLDTTVRDQVRAYLLIASAVMKEIFFTP
jgi:AcrR family transcriptional regulator